jgi:hypothetical protein
VTRKPLAVGAGRISRSRPGRQHRPCRRQPLQHRQPSAGANPGLW